MPWNDITSYVTGQKVTAAVWSDVVENFAYLEQVGSAVFTTDKTVTHTAVGTADQIVSLGAITYENVPHMLHFFCPHLTPDTGQLRIIVRDGSTVLGTLGRWDASGTGAPVNLWYPVTPTAAEHTYNIAGWLAAAGTWTFDAGSGGAAGDAGTDLNGFLRAFRVAT